MGKRKIKPENQALVYQIVDMKMRIDDSTFETICANAWVRPDKWEFSGEKTLMCIRDQILSLLDDVPENEEEPLPAGASL